MKRLPASALLIAYLFSSCGDSSPVKPPRSGPPDDVEMARRKAAWDHARAMRQRLVDYHEAGRHSYMEHVEERLRARWPAETGHEADFQNAVEDARQDYERMLQEQLDQLDRQAPSQGSLGNSASGRGLICYCPP